jgi:hypothetical protein
MTSEDPVSPEQDVLAEAIDRTVRIEDMGPLELAYAEAMHEGCEDGPPHPLELHSPWSGSDLDGVETWYEFTARLARHGLTIEAIVTLSPPSKEPPMTDPMTREDPESRLAEAVSDSLAATTEGTDYAEAPVPSDEPGSPYVMRLTHELIARGVAASPADGADTLPLNDENGPWCGCGNKLGHLVRNVDCDPPADGAGLSDPVRAALTVLRAAAVKAGAHIVVTNDYPDGVKAFGILCDAIDVADAALEGASDE